MDLKKYKADIVFWLVIALGLIIGYQLKEVVMPFIVALIMAMAFSPLANWFQKLLKKRVLAVSSALVSVIIVITSILLIFTTEIIRDANRLGNTFTQFASVNSAQIDESAGWVKDKFDDYISPLIKEGEGKLDSISNQGFSQLVQSDSITNKLNTDQLSAVYNALFSSEESTKEEAEESELSWILVFFSSIGYFLYMIYTWSYFQTKINFLKENKKLGRISQVVFEFKTVFKAFLRQRGLIVLIYTLYFLISFYVLGLPGALILGLIAGLLCFVPYLQYVILIPIALFCVILNMEGELGYFFYLGISTAIFIVGTLVEELVLIPKIFKQENSINPAVLMFALAVFGETMGLLGIMLAVPFTILIKLYLKRLLV